MSNSTQIQEVQLLPNLSELEAMNNRIMEIHENLDLIIRWIGSKFGSDPDFPFEINKGNGITVQEHDVVEFDLEFKIENMDEDGQDVIIQELNDPLEFSPGSADLGSDCEIESNVFCSNRDREEQFAEAEYANDAIAKVKSFSKTDPLKSNLKNISTKSDKTNALRVLSKQQQLQQETELIRPCSIKLLNVLKHPAPDPEISSIIQKFIPDPVIVPSSSNTNTNPVPEKQLHKCPSCLKEYTQKSHLTVHMKIHAGEKPYVCEFCGKGFIQNTSLLYHRQFHTGEKPYSCDVCGLSFNQSKQVRAHKAKDHPGTKPYTCKFCYQGLGSLEELTTHTQTHLNADTPWSCDFCGKVFKIRYTRNAHRRIHLGKYLLKCEVCGKQFFIPGQYKTHLALHHSPEKRETSKHICDICGKPCNYNNLRDHRLTHVSIWETSFECRICSKRFNSEKKLKVHGQAHTGNRQYPCRICGKRFSISIARNTHEKSHRGEFQCKICGKNMAQATALKKHILSNHGSKNECENCGKYFVLCGKLKNHQEKHPICSIYYQQKEQSNSNPNSVSSESLPVLPPGPPPPAPVEYKCHKCGKHFDKKGGLNIHKRKNSCSWSTSSKNKPDDSTSKSEPPPLEQIIFLNPFPEKIMKIEIIESRS